MLENLIYLFVAIIAVGLPVLYFLRERKKSRIARITLEKAVERGLDEPVSLHPFIDPAICIGTAACVKACPESNVLGVIENRGQLINPAKCIGHGQCQAACPVDAITLVFGTAKRGVDIPYVSGTFETNRPGIYIAGELGGMGLIRNAITQGKQAAQNIALSLEGVTRGGELDLVIVGAGPAGIAAALQAKKDGLQFVLLDQVDLGGTILTYPRRKLVMTQPMDLPIYGKIVAREIQKEELLTIFKDVFRKTGLEAQTDQKVDEITGENGFLMVRTARHEYAARRVLLSIGRRGSPRKLGVPGENSGKVFYRLLDPEKFHDLQVLVVGGGDSAVEAAVALAEQPGNTVFLSYRREAIFRIKEGNERRLEEAVRDGRITPVYKSEVTRIEERTVHLMQDGSELHLPNDFTFVFAGGELPTEFLKKAGIEFTRKFGEA
ncbi:MAG: NAD(P)-binding domain-containing protein [Calditrichota bacterium]